MKYMKRAKIYQCSNYNCTFSPEKIEAYSYRWWKFVALVDGKVIFNNYRYSNSTSKHQSKVRRLLESLNIKINIEMPLASGIKEKSLSELIIEGEETLCDLYLAEEAKAIDRSIKAKRRRVIKALENHLENEVHFRDYEIRDAKSFGVYNKIAVHQVVEKKTLESDVQNALYNFNRDGFSSVVFYV